MSDVAPTVVAGNFAEVAARSQERADTQAQGIKVEARAFSFWYGTFQALHNVNLAVQAQHVTALIGPSGCGKSTLLRAINRMHDRTPGTRGNGTLQIDGADVYGSRIDPVQLRRHVGMVFQRPNPFAKTIFDNVAYGLRLQGVRGRRVLRERVEGALQRAALWDEVKDLLGTSGLALSGGQQQRLCIARAIATVPDVVLMDEPCSALDPIATSKIEDLIHDLRRNFTIIIVTHNLQQAARVGDQTAFMLMDPQTRAGTVIEAQPTDVMFTRPRDQRTADYLSGRWG